MSYELPGTRLSRRYDPMSYRELEYLFPGSCTTSLPSGSHAECVLPQQCFSNVFLLPNQNSLITTETWPLQFLNNMHLLQKGNFANLLCPEVWTLPTIINNLYERNETWSSGFPSCRVAQNKEHADEATVTSCVVILTVAVEHFPPTRLLDPQLTFVPWL